MTENKSIICSLEMKALLTASLNTCDHVLHFNFKIADITGSVNTAADFLTELDFEVKEKIRLKIREDIETTPIE